MNPSLSPSEMFEISTKQMEIKSREMTVSGLRQVRDEAKQWVETTRRLRNAASSLEIGKPTLADLTSDFARILGETQSKANSVFHNSIEFEKIGREILSAVGKDASASGLRPNLTTALSVAQAKNVYESVLGRPLLGSKGHHSGNL